MRHSTFFKFIAVILCAASILGAVTCGTALILLTEFNGTRVEEKYQERLESHAYGYATEAAGIYASENLGTAHRNLINQYYGNDWETRYFNWTQVGYTLYDSQGQILQEQEIPSGLTPEYTFHIPVFGQYLKVISAEPYVESESAPTEPVRLAPEIHIMPTQESIPIGAVQVEYTDGHTEEWGPSGREQFGILYYTGGDTVSFLSNFGEIPMGDGWYPNHILMLDMGGNAVYEVSGSSVILGSELTDDYSCCIYLPAGTVTSAAPVGTTISVGDYTAYDAIPAAGATVTALVVSYDKPQSESAGSEGVSSPELIGTLYHDSQGNARFQSKDALPLEIPQGSIITGITFVDGNDTLIFEASCPSGVGFVEYDAQGRMSFLGQMPGTEPPQETVPEVTEPEATQETEVPILLTVTTTEKTMVYNMPRATGIVLEILEKGITLDVEKLETYEDTVWGLVAGGWIILPEQTGAAAGSGRAMGTAPDAAAAPANEAEVPEPEQAEAATESTQIPAQTHPQTEEESAAATTLTDPTADPASTDPTQPAEAGESVIYYDYDTNRTTEARIVTEALPEGWTAEVRLAKGALRDDFTWTLLRLAESFRHILLEALGICIICLVLCVVYLCCAAGHKRGSTQIQAGGLNRIPLDLYLVLGSLGGAVLAVGTVEVTRHIAAMDEYLAIVLCFAGAYTVCLLAVGIFFAFVAQIKTPDGFWWRNTVCGYFCRGTLKLCTHLERFCRTGFKKAIPLLGRFFPWTKQTCIRLWLFGKLLCLKLWDCGKRLLLWLWNILKMWGRRAMTCIGRLFYLLPITWQFLLTGFLLIFMLYIALRSYKVGWILLAFGIFFAVILYAASAFAILLENAKHMSKGDLDSKVNDRMLVGSFREFAAELNTLADVVTVAAQKQLKSERMKTELITNVSHDIKTPLTSIINYVDLLKRPHNEQEQEMYLEVLSRQSLRLKKLIDDLMEMSKASTGNMPVDIIRMNAAEAVNQALGEFADKLEKAQLYPVFRHPEEPLEILADGRLVWRVMSNLLSNTVKYAQPGTRVYLDMIQADNKVVISIKNISREELNVSADELLERFVRGDVSRNTEGSGLGLNIAQSLMELQQGQLQLLVDGDLFKVTLIFPAA